MDIQATGGQRQNTIVSGCISNIFQNKKAHAAHVKEIIEKRTARRTEFVRSVVQAGAAGRRKVARMPANTSGKDPTTRRTAES